jgi:hypothetical protein
LEVVCLARYEIEQLQADHTGLWTRVLEVCAVARCRESGGQPWLLAIRCDHLPRVGRGRRSFSLAWKERTEREADRAEKTLQEKTVTEMAAIGVCAASFSVLGEGSITEVTQHGSGVDYWVDDRRAVLEASGVKAGAAEDMDKRHREKVQQLGRSLWFRMGKPGYVFVAVFSQKQARFSYHHP